MGHTDTYRDTPKIPQLLQRKSFNNKIAIETIQKSGFSGEFIGLIVAQEQLC